jgi:hypothetical protein
LLPPLLAPERALLPPLRAPERALLPPLLAPERALLPGLLAPERALLPGLLAERALRPALRAGALRSLREPGLRVRGPALGVGFGLLCAIV